ncbi:hypothetical protein [Streptomyces sp. NPDC060002]|uniref:hypothetical protein n=1 Tax=Streptomyces sp. NPDC060002 TaxID=3347033 RepID=UPI0036ADB2BA
MTAVRPDGLAGAGTVARLAGSLHIGEMHTGDVYSPVSGGTFTGPVLRGRDFSGLSFTTPAPPRVDPVAGTPPPPG